MSPDHDEDEPTQTTPAGAEIPVPERDEVMDAFRRVVDAHHGITDGGIEDGATVDTR